MEMPNNIEGILRTTGESLANIIGAVRGEREVNPETDPPVGSKDTYGGNVGGPGYDTAGGAGTAFAGGSGLLILAAIAFFLFK